MKPNAVDRTGRAVADTPHMARPPNIVVLTGAGISRESGLGTFRGPGGLWDRVRIEDVATPDAFRRDTARVHAFYNGRRAQLRDAEPNGAHRALAELDARWPAGFLLVTQNVDDLHGRAGARRLLHMHGELRESLCGRCGDVRRWEEDLSTETPCPTCRAVGGMRPNVVWFNEMPRGVAEIEAALDTCDLFVSVGTSGVVYPAANFVAAARGRARTVELNPEPSAGADLFDEARRGPATMLVPELVRELLAAWP